MKSLVGPKLLACFIICLAPMALAQPDPDDAQILAYELTGELVGPPAVVAAIEGELATIRATYSFANDIGVYPSAAPGALMVQLTPIARAYFLDGHPTAFADLNAAYGVVEVRTFQYSDDLFVRFGTPYNPWQLESIYESLVTEVVEAYVSPVGGDGPDIEIRTLGDYRFFWRWGDCPSGCIWEYWWDIEVTGGQARILGTGGDRMNGLSDTAHPPATPSLHANTPNPFNPSTTISFGLGANGPVRLTIYDLAGLRVATLLDEFRQAGPGRVLWNGRDDRGNTVAAGVYLYRLETAGMSLTRRMVLLK